MEKIVKDHKHVFLLYPPELQDFMQFVWDMLETENAKNHFTNSYLLKSIYDRYELLFRYGSSAQRTKIWLSNSELLCLFEAYHTDSTYPFFMKLYTEKHIINKYFDPSEIVRNEEKIKFLK